MSDVQITPKSWLMLASLGVIGGASFMAVKLGLRGFEPLTLVAIRLVLASLLLWATARALSVAVPDLRDRKMRLSILAWALLSSFLPFVLLTWGQVHVSSSFAGLMMGSIPLFVMPIGRVLLRDDPLTTRRIIGVVTGFAGVALLIGLPQDDWTFATRLGALACMGAAICYALGSVVARLSPPVHPIFFSAASLSVSACLAVIAALAVEGWPAPAPGIAWAGAIYLAVGPAAVATLLMIGLIQTAGPGFLSLMNYQIPVWATIFGTLVLGEALPASFVAALVLVLSGLAISRGRPRV